MGLLDAYVTAATARNTLTTLWPKVELTVCRAAGDELLVALDIAPHWVKKNDDGTMPDLSAPLQIPHSYEASAITTKATAFETVLTAELQGLPTYHATRKGIYSMP